MHTRPESASEQHLDIANYTTASYRGLSGIRSSLLQSFPLQSDAAAFSSMHPRAVCTNTPASHHAVIYNGISSPGPEIDLTTKRLAQISQNSQLLFF